MAEVLFVAPDLHGGVGRCVAFIADALPDRGIDTSLFLLRRRLREYSMRNPKVSRALPIIESGNLLRLALPFAFLRLLREIRREDPAIVCSHGLLSNILVIAAKKLLRKNFHTVAFEHSSPADHYGGTKLRHLKCWLLERSYRQHNAVIGVSRGVADDLVTMFPSLQGKCQYIYNGVPLDEVRQQSEAEPRPVRTADAPYQVVALGRLEAVKDYATLIDAAALLDDPNITFTILGEGSEQAALEKRIAANSSRSKVTLAGHIDNPFPALANADAFALTSTRESFGNVLVEALCLGVPVVSTDCPHGPSEILDQGRYGLLVPVGDAAALAEAVRKLAYDGAIREHFSSCGPERANVFSLEQHCLNVVALFSPLLRRPVP